MKILDWKSENFCCAMVEDEERRMWTTTAGIALALGVDVRALYNIYRRRKDQFGLSETDRYTKESVMGFLRQHTKHFGIKRIKEDMHVWSEDDVLVFAVLCRSPQADLARKDFLQFIKSNMRREYATLQTQYNELLQRLMLVEEALPSVQKLRSSAGVSLAACRGTTALRDLN